MKLQSKKVFLIITIIIILFATSTVIFLMCNTAFDYIAVLIINEQNDHYCKMIENTQKLKKYTFEIQADVELLMNNELTNEKKQEIYGKLRELESVSFNISKETGFYQEDTTVHFFFSPSGEIVSLFDRTRNTPVYVNRFVRAVEQGLFEIYLTKKQKEIIKKDFDLLKSEVESL